MLELATGDNPLFEVCDLEIKRPGPSYTVDTLAEIGSENPGTDLFFIIGIDAYDEINTWSRPEQLLQLAHIIVTTRPGHEFPDGAPLPPIAGANACCYDPCIGCCVHESGHMLIGAEIRGIEVSASHVRKCLATGRPIDTMTGKAVASYIRSHRLYGATNI